ncbi:MAG: hypothetical protein JO207_08585 [Verrucomicrobia bacterium]|nr:hypothetical protein [Verrucomicrobiota bacterium]
MLLPDTVVARDIYLAVRGDARSGSGSPQDPFDASTAARYDAILARFRAGTNFHYAAGIYETRGGRYIIRPTANSNCHHYGAGVDRTIIRLIGASIPTQEGVIFYNDYNITVNGFEVHDLALDCNAQGNPIFTNGLGAVGGINVIGNNLLFTGLKIEHFGTGRRGVECFPFFSWGYSGGQFSNIVLQNSLFTNPAKGNKDGLSTAVIGAPSDATIEGAIINCQFIDLKSDFSYSHAFGAPLCQGNKVTNCEVGFYLEPDDRQLGKWVIRDNRFTNVYVAALVNWHPTGTLNSIQMENNIVLLTGDPHRSSAAFEIQDSGLAPGEQRPSIAQVIFKGNQVDLAAPSTPPVSTALGICLVSAKSLFTIGNLVLESNAINLPPSQGLIITPGTVVKRWSASDNIDSHKVQVHVLDAQGKPL